jgi:DNA replication and repair protein RecF
MYLSYLDLNHFRNIKPGKYYFSKGLNIFLGNNGAGKTSILEAISFLSTVSSFRKINKTEFIKWGRKYCNVICELNRGEDEEQHELRLGFSDSGQKMGKVNGVLCKRLMDYIGKLNLIIFLPQDLNIVNEAPKLRRNLIDRIAFNFISEHLAALQDYNKVKHERNAVLKGMSKQYGEDILEIYDQNLVKTGSMVLYNRLTIIKQINESSSSVFQKLTGSFKTLKLNYKSSVHLDMKSFDFDSINKAFSDEIARYRQSDIEKCTTSNGPHVDDIEILIDDKRADFFASLGQQRLSIIAIKLCEMIKFKEKLGEYPVILLDDIFAGLDRDKAMKLIDFFNPEIQVFLTTTHIDEYLLSKTKAKIFRVENGVVKYVDTKS